MFVAKRLLLSSGLLVGLVLAWGLSCACFPVFSPRVAEKGAALKRIDKEVDPVHADLRILSVEVTPSGRRFHLALRGYLAGRPADHPLRFVYDEGQEAPIRVVEAKTSEPTPDAGHPVRIMHWQDLTHQAADGTQLQERGPLLERNLAQAGGLPENVLVESRLDTDRVTLAFSYRDQRNVIVEGKLVIIPRQVMRHPVLAGLNKLNYLWSVPADAVVVVGGWCAFIAVAPIAVILAR